MSEITIQCGICARPVDRVEMWRVVDSFPGTEIVAHCHGQKDRMLLTDHFLSSLPSGDLRGYLVSAVAFQSPALSKPQTQ